MILELTIAAAAGWGGWKLGRNAIDDRVIGAFNNGFDAGAEFTHRRLHRPEGTRPPRLEDLVHARSAPGAAGAGPRAYDAELVPVVRLLDAPVRRTHSDRYPDGGDDRP